MLLYLIRHGEAMNEFENPARPLTPNGVRDVEKVADFIAAWASTQAIYHSGKLRAKETAEIFAERLNPEAGPVEKDGLKPGDDPHIWADRVATEQKDVMLVGHLPHLARLASLLVSGSSDKAAFDFEPSSILCLEYKGERWWTDWMVRPALL